MNPIDMMVTDANCEYLGLSRLCLMESAGKSLGEEVAKIAVFKFSKPVKVIMFTGSGGNGGDAFVAARYLLNRGYDVEINLLKDNIKSPQAKINYEILMNMKPRLSRLSINNLKTPEDIEACSIGADTIVIDGILGTGIKGNLQTNIRKAIEVINDSNALKVSVDVPSGMDPLTGEISDIAVVPDYTVSFHKIKSGVRNSYEEDVGGLVICDIGIPLEAEYYINYGDFLRLKSRDDSSHKGNNGRVLIIGGCKDYHGAPSLAGMAAINSGCDLVYVAVPSSAATPVKSISPDLIVKSFGDDYLSFKDSDEILKLANNVDAVLIGPGAGINDETSKLFNILVSKIKKPIVLDADGLKQIELNLIKNNDNIILTPHLAEFNTFFNSSLSRIDLDSYDFEKIDNTIEEVQRISKSVKATTVLKGKYDLVLKDNRFKINKTGNAGMTVGGTGDVLAGICSGFLAQGLNTFDAASLAVFINGLAGEKAFDKSDYAFTASDLISHIGEVIRDGLR